MSAKKRNRIEHMWAPIRASATVFSFLVMSMTSAMALPAFTFTGGTTTTFSDRTLGYNFFTGTDPFTVTSLGYWDQGGDGLAESHQVGIWTADGSVLLASAIVPAGTGAVLDSGFRFVAIAPVILSANTEYLAGAFNGEGDSVIRFTTATENLGLTLGSTRFDPLPFQGVFTAPTGTQGTTFDDGYFGPNLNGAAAAIPEPATLALLGTGLLGLAAARRRKAA